jgi:DNA modification methylase
MPRQPNNYKKVLPLKDKIKVIDQFGWLPVSVIEPTRGNKSKWKDAYLESSEYRRPEQYGFLGGLKFSEFHAGLAEDILKYWSVVDSVVVDPFAGRCTRAFVSSTLNRQYIGYDVSPTTIKKSREHLAKYNLNASLIEGDGCLMTGVSDNVADLVFTCPPYYNIEKYESVNGQLSDCDNYEQFLKQINECTKNIHRVLKSGGFCVWVCGDFRESRQFRSFSTDSINTFKENGLIHYDTIIMKNMSPFVTLQMSKVAAKRYTSKTHEYILVFRKEGELDYPSEDIVSKRTSLDNFLT